MTGPADAHDFVIVFGHSPSDTSIVIDGEPEKHCRRIRVEQATDGPAVVTLELYARNVKMSGVSDDVLEINIDHDDGDEVIEHNYGPGQPGVLRHFKRNSKGCLLCDPAAESRGRKLSD